ncbi:MAG: MaoC family dehydratase N-terminal domain-containing protein [Planctomycetes bacterium]|nr:MaoC family dehydratase N-terminal domain-containing protein [Planctomycetota bacterium]
MTFEQFEVGQTLDIAARTITEADIVNFAGLSGDFNPLHMDEEFAKTTPFGKRIAHGMLTLSVATGLAGQAGYLDGTTIAFLGLEVKFTSPTFAGDTIRGHLKVTHKRETSKPDRGVVAFALEVTNQRKEKVAEGKWTLMIRREPKEKR